MTALKAPCSVNQESKNASAEKRGYRGSFAKHVKKNEGTTRPVSKPNVLQKTATNKNMSLRRLRRIASQIAGASSQTKFESLREAFIKGFYGDVVPLTPAPPMIESPAKNLRREILASLRLTIREARSLQQAFRDADIKLLRQAEKSFGGAEGARAFLARPAHGLGGKIPILHTVTKKGRAEVMLLMKRIDRGILA
jgi:hypothetical protein